MTRYRLLFTLLFGCFQLAACHAAESYIGVMAGGVGRFDVKDAKMDTSLGYYAGGRIGLKYAGFLRLEEELSYQHSNVHAMEKKGSKLHRVKGHVRFWSWMTNALFDLDCPLIITPYIGGGIGYMHGAGKASPNQAKGAKHKFHQGEFAWQLIAGLKYWVFLGLEASLEYRYCKIQDVDVNHKVGLALTKFF